MNTLSETRSLDLYPETTRISELSISSSSPYGGGGGYKSLNYIPLISNFLSLPASSLRCYRCQSRKSWEHCDGNTTETKCNLTNARCVKYSYKNKDANVGNRKAFARGCLPQSQCSGSQIPACKDLQKSGDKMKACTVTCCGEDLCNSQVMLNSAVLLFLMMLLIHTFFVKVSLRSAK